MGFTDKSRSGNPQLNKMTDPFEAALRDGMIGKRQHNALKRHAQKHSQEHIKRMLALMRHTTFAKAHKQAMQEVGS